MLNSIFFSTYEMVEKRMNAGKQLGEHDVSYFTVGVAGGIGGGLQAFPCTLIEFAKIKLQNQTGKPHISSYTSISVVCSHAIIKSNYSLPHVIACCMPYTVVGVSN